MRILLIDDHALFAQSLKFLLAEMDTRVECVAAGSIAEALALGGDFDLVLLDLHLPGNVGFAGLRTILAALEGVPVALLSGEEKPQVIHAAIAEGAMGYVPKSSSPQVLMAAMHLILAGGAYLPPHVLAAAGSLPDTPAADADVRAKLGGLTERQREVLLKAVQGKPNKVIAREMSLAEGTVKAHLSTAFRVLEVNNRTEAVFKAAQLGLTV